MEWKAALKKAKRLSRPLEAILKDCKPVGDNILMCRHSFHHQRLVGQYEIPLKAVFGADVRVLRNDPLVEYAVDELGAIVWKTC